MEETVEISQLQIEQQDVEVPEIKTPRNLIAWRVHLSAKLKHMVEKSLI